jgi:hypothetical protein
MIKDDYREETNLDVYEYYSQGSYSDDYVKWLETKLQLLQSRVVGHSEQFYCDGEENNNDRCESQCLGCAGMEEINSQ